VWLAAVGVLFAVIGAYYYIRVVWYMYFADAADTTPLVAAADMRIVISANALGLLVLGLFPGGLLDLCAASARRLELCLAGTGAGSV
jgi:NADH-quinone oxidoreductase subunit N